MSSEDAAAAAYAAQLTGTGQPSYPDRNQGPLLIRVVWVLIALSSVVAAGRIYTKARKTHRLYWDDALILLALAFGVIFSAMVTVAVGTGLGRHMAYLNMEEREKTLHIGTLALAWAFLSPMAGRMAFCVTLLFLTGTDPRVKKWPVWLFLILQFVVNISAIIVFYSQCGDELDIVWTPSKLLQYYTKCLDPQIQTDYGYFQGAFNTLTDLFLTALPAVLIEHARLSIKTKVGLTFLLCLSVLAMIASIVKTYEAKALSEVLDYTWDLCPYVIWLSIELNVVIITSSIPFLRPLFRGEQQRRIEQQLMQKWDTSTFGSVFSKNGARANMSRIESEDEENIIEPSGSRYPRIEMQKVGEREPGITVTTEVSVTYQPTDLPFVHAALVGLVQGEIANPNLVRK